MASPTAQSGLIGNLRRVDPEFAAAEQAWASPLPGDASFRHYCRITSPSGKRMMLMDAPAPHESTRPFATIAEDWFAAGIAVPELFAVDDDAGFIAMEDLDDRTLFSLTGPRVAARSTEIEHYYQAAIESLCRIQALPLDSEAVNAMPRYDEALLRRETALFRDWLLEACLELSPAVVPQSHELLTALDDVLVLEALAQPHSVVHRDYHSRNLMIDERDAVRIIDFQDAVVGPSSYDLVSLLKDCYVLLDDSLRQRLMTHYIAHSGSRTGQNNVAAFTQVQFDLMGMQRHLKAAGIFARLYRRDGKARYLKDIPLVLTYLADTAAALSKTSRYVDIMQRLETLLRKEVIPAYDVFARTTDQP
ncbi:aminoglycoside phosphotransferase family protein [Allohahella marinimesophila]